jgi:hypothetical protein
MSGQTPAGVQTPGQRVLVDVLPLFLIFFLILMGHMSSGFELTAHFDPALFLVPVFFLALHSRRNFTPVIIMFLGFFKDVVDGTPVGFWGVLVTFFYFAAQGQQQVLVRASLRGRWLGYTGICSLTFLIGYLIAAVRDDMLSLFWLSMGSAALSSLWFLPISLILGLLIVEEQE